MHGANTKNVPGFFMQGVQQSGCVDDHTALSCVRVTNEWRYRHLCAHHEGTHKDICTFTEPDCFVVVITESSDVTYQ